MQLEEIREVIKSSIASVASIDVSEISDSASYKQDLGLDSLSILEIAVDIESRFGMSVPEEELTAIRNIDDTVELILRHIGAEATACASASLSAA